MVELNDLLTTPSFLRSLINNRLTMRSLSIARGLVCALLLLFATACAPARAPIAPGEIPSARQVTTAEEQYGHSILQSLSEQYPLEYNDPALGRVQDVVDRLTKAARADDQPWHVFLFRADHVVNAAATRGNHLFVWSGLMNTIQSDDELAVILAHEIAHVLAGHTDPDPNEELKKILISVGALAAGVAVTATTRSPSFAADLGNLTTSLTQQVGEGFLLNPYSRSLEIEADTIGLMLMAEAKYNPEAAVTFWTRATSHPNFRSGIDFLSTHPPTEARVANVEKMMPLAEQRYRGEYTPTAGSGIKTGEHLVDPPDPNDSFDLTLTRTERPKGSSSTSQKTTEARVQLVELEAHGQNRWLIVTPYADIYAQPSFKSDRVGRIGHGDRFTVDESAGEWVRISQPHAGYIRMVEARPLAVVTP